MARLFKPRKFFPIPSDAERLTHKGKPAVRVNGEVYPVHEDGTRYVHTDDKWCADIRGADGRRKRHRLSTDRAAAQVMLADLLKRIEQEKAGVRTPALSKAAMPLADHLGSVWRIGLVGQQAEVASEDG